MSSHAVLIVPADLPDDQVASFDGYRQPVFKSLWYWAREIYYPLNQEQVFFVIVSGPVSPLTFAKEAA